MAYTFNRPPVNLPVRSVNDKIFDFAKFNGLNDNQNYVNQDPFSFADADNVYVDQDNQLSSRPPLRYIDLPLTVSYDDAIINIYKVNNILFYHVKDINNLYYLCFKYKDIGSRELVSKRIKVIWLDKRFIIFCEGKTLSFEYDEKNKRLQWYDTKDTIYVPISKIITGKEEKENEPINYLSGNEIHRYIISEKNPLDSTVELSIIGRNVKVQIGDEFYNIDWQRYNEKVLTRDIGISPLRNTEDKLYISSVDTAIAVRNRANGGYEVTYSLDCSKFFPIILPNDIQYICFADDGSCLWGIHFDLETKKSIKIYHIDLSGITTPGIINAEYSTYEYTIGGDLNYGANLWTNSKTQGNKRYMTSTDWEFSTFDLDEVEFHSPENGKLVIGTRISAIGYTDTTFTNTYATPGRKNRNNQLFSCMITCINNKISIDVCNITQMRNIKLVVGKNKYITFQDTMIPLDDDYKPYYYYANYSSQIVGPSGTKWLDYVYKDCSIYLPGIYFSPSSKLSTDIDRSTYAINRSDSLIFSIAYGQIYNGKLEEFIESTTIKRTGFAINWPDAFIDKFTYSDDNILDISQRKKSPLLVESESNRQVLINTEKAPASKESIQYKLCGGNLLTDRYYRYLDTNIKLLPRAYTDIIPIACINNIYYLDSFKHIFTTRGYNAIVDQFVIVGNTKYIIPEHDVKFMVDTSIIDPNLVANVLSLENKVYGTYKRDGRLYLPVSEIQTFSGDITELTNFTKTSIGIFLEDAVYEWSYLDGLYTLSKTKLQLGCKKGSEVLLAYDGRTILMTTINGLTTLNHQDFVQSTDQVFNYLTENIMSMYDKFSEAPIKLTQYKNWIFLYRTDLNYFYLYDLRNKSWWKWSCSEPIEQMMTSDKDLLILQKGKVMSFEFTNTGKDYYDGYDISIDWYCTSRRLHFMAPNNYKHVRSIAVINNKTEDSRLTLSLELKCYHNMYDTTNVDIVEHELNELSTAIKRVNFTKLNAFQFTIGNYKDSTERCLFVTPDIVIKYRITERIR